VRRRDIASHLYTYPPTIVGGMPPVQSFRAQNAIRIRILNYGACMERVRARHFAHSKWACFYAQNSSWAGLGNFGTPFRAVNWQILAVNWRILAVNWRILAVNWRIRGGPTPPGLDIYLWCTLLVGGTYIYFRRSWS
jgi:hypothetical protein